MSDSTDTTQQKIEFIVDKCTDILCSEAIREVRHYLDQGELEIAFEGLFLELIQVGRIPESIDKVSCVQLAKYFHLDVESVLDDNFWVKLTHFLNQNN